jgi:hypothetical protein
MKSSLAKLKLFYLAGSVILLIVSCSKELSSVHSSSSTTSSSTTSSVIAVAVDSASGDSIYVIQPCARGYFRDSVAESSLPTAVINYLDSNYAGFSFTKAFVIKDSAGTIGGYVAIIQYNGKPVAILFSGGGTFIQVLEQRESGDLEGPGWHTGGRYHDRNGRQADTIAFSAIPSAISNYFTSNYPNDTLTKAYINIDSSYLLISVDNGVYATLFNSSGTFVKRVQLSPISRSDWPSASNIAQDSLPASVLSYLETTYPNYVFEKAFSVTANSSLQGYIVVIDANNTKYAVLFDASGNYISTRIIW